jgi:class 3 adenylate cyclase
MKRRLSAILAADIVGYSKFVAADDEETVRRLADYRRIFDAVTTQFGGRVVNMTGDAVLAEFPNSMQFAARSMRGTASGAPIASTRPTGASLFASGSTSATSSTGTVRFSATA